MGVSDTRVGAVGKAPLTCSTLDELVKSDSFLWATGIEDTFVCDRHPSTGRILDEYELTEHYQRWRDDLDLVAELGVPYVRYGIPWYKVQPGPDSWDWSFADATLNRLLELGVQPIVDLVHYGTPEWIENGFLSPDYPTHVAHFAREVAQRYAGRIWWYTPLNEPRVTAWYSGKLGWWPPYGRGDRGFASVLLSLSEGIVLTHRALKEVDPEIVCCHVDATDLYSSTDPVDQELADWKQALVFLPLDLVTGRVTPDHVAYMWLLRNGATKERLEWLIQNGVEPDLVGLNMYPMFTNKVVIRKGASRKIRNVRGSADLVRRLGEMYHERYGRPMVISETASDGSVEVRSKWLEGSLESVRELRESGVPMVGYTWWPMFALVAWAYRQSTQKPIGDHLVQMGLWDLDGRLDRIRTPLVDQYRELVACGGASVGPHSARAREVELVP
jgi:beta-glucosidase/6-phospho-beta-glucosidase/beta-galactosidase